MSAVVGVQDGAVQAAPGALRCGEGVEDEFGAHVLGDGVAGQPA